MNYPVDGLLSDMPVVVQRRILWGDCDPANVVYTPRFADYVVWALDWFMIAALGSRERPVGGRPGLGYPMRAMAFEFTAFLRADDLLRMTVRVQAISTRTFTLVVDGAQADGAAAFKAVCTSVCVEQSDGTAVALPPELRAALERYRAQQDSA